MYFPKDMTESILIVNDFSFFLILNLTGSLFLVLVTCHWLLRQQWLEGVWHNVHHSLVVGKSERVKQISVMSPLACNIIYNTSNCPIGRSEVQCRRFQNI